MPRLNTLFHCSAAGYPGPEAIASGYPWLLDLETQTGRRQLDVVIAARFRITSWRLSGSVQVIGETETLTDILDVNVESFLQGAQFLDERDFAIQGALEEDPQSNFTNAMLVVQDSGTWANFNFGALWIKHSPIHGDVAAVNFTFTAFGPTSSGNVVTAGVGYSPPPHGVAGTLLISIPAWRGSGYHTLSTPLWSADPDTHGDFTIEALTCWPYADAVNVPVWDGGTCEALIDPVTAHVDMP